MRVLVTGSEGSIGTKLVAHLRSLGHSVMGADIVHRYADDYIQTDVSSLQDLIYVAQTFKPEVVYHMAAAVSRITCEESPHLAVATNVLGTHNVVQMCRNINARLINFSTSEVYGNISGILSEEVVDLKPNNRYGVTMLAAEKLVEYDAMEHGLRAVTIRPCMIYDEDEPFGVHRSAIIRFAEALERGNRITVHKMSKRSWLHMDDMLRALESLLLVDIGYQVINIGHPEVLEMMAVALRMCDIGRHNINLVTLADLPKRMTLSKIPDLRKQKALLNFEPKISLHDGMQRLVNRVRERVANGE